MQLERSRSLPLQCYLVFIESLKLQSTPSRLNSLSRVIITIVLIIFIFFVVTGLFIYKQIMIVRYFKYINNVLQWHLSTERDRQKGAFQDKVETQVFFIYLFIFFPTDNLRK